MRTEQTFDDDFCFVEMDEGSNITNTSTTTTTAAADQFVSKYPDQEAKYEEIEQSPSRATFSVDTGQGQVFYCLSTTYDREKVSQITGEMHNCRHCKIRMSQMAGYFGPNGYAVDLQGAANDAGRLYSQIEREREALQNGKTSLCQTIDPQRTFIISKENLDRYPRALGVNSETGENHIHIGLNYADTSCQITTPELARKISPNLMNKLRNGSMDGRLKEIVTMLQRKNELTGETDLVVIKRIAKSDEVLRKEFWEYRIDAVEKIQTFARKFKNGDNDWELMSDVDKMHVRVFALLYGGGYSDSENPIFKAISHVVDISKDAISIHAIPGYMNERTDPNSYMIQQVAKRNIEKSVNAPFIVSLSWGSASDLDGRIKMVHTGETISYHEMRSHDGQTYLNFDANASCPTKEPVETFTLSSKSPGKYIFMVNNYHTRGNEDIIPFAVILNLNGEIQVFEDSWDCRIRGNNNNDNESKMIHMCTVEITKEMISSLNTEYGLSSKQANRLGRLLLKFKEKFGCVTTTIANMSLLGENVTILKSTSLRNNKSLHTGRRECEDNANNKINELSAMVQRTMVQHKPLRLTLGPRSTSRLEKFCDILQSLQGDSGSSGLSIGIQGRNYYPSTITTHSCGGQLKKNAVINSYIEEGKPPVQPNAAIRETCRFEKEWSNDFAGILCGTAVLPAKTMFYDGYFISLGNTRFPTAAHTKWCVGAGMYPTDLLTENHEFREIWAVLHSSVRPSLEETNGSPAIGVFLHRGKSYELIVNGITKLVII
eukprot:CAMPEP_0194408294 /NCGR_PEP_ID=MMETSP0176-20130528/6219_1 /TAXON_ID=216777 /ORGANISM="Proboscia alata, Strain PI-D3" /LENGTH=772 /DNA_ID=CAMNT_0039208343 /DNA_START=45 /DNA_END=2366 /DNA_ORIENTATION=+